MMRASAAAIALVLAGASAVPAQTGRGCTIREFTDPPRQVLTCRDGLIVETQRDAAATLSDADGDGAPDRASVTGRGILVDMPPGRRGGFQILTPHAIASVRGTVYAVDVGERATAVFVQQGRVEVTKRAGGESVTLGPGEGVDVDPAQPLEVRRWPSERALGFLARFGR
jgi:hypothetical protein